MTLETLSIAVVASSLLVSLYSDIKCIIVTDKYLDRFMHLFQLSTREYYFLALRSILVTGAFAVAGFSARLSALWFFSAILCGGYSLFVVALILSPATLESLQAKYNNPLTDASRRKIHSRAKGGIVLNSIALVVWFYAWLG